MVIEVAKLLYHWLAHIPVTSAPISARLALPPPPLPLPLFHITKLICPFVLHEHVTSADMWPRHQR